MEFDFINYKKETGLDKNDKQLLKNLKEGIDFLFCHNKNYTKSQYNKIIEIYDIILNINKL